MAAEARIADTVSVEDSMESAPRVASKTEQKADAVAKVSADLVDPTSADTVAPTSADTAALTSVKPAQRSVPRWVYSEVPLSR
ncbi:MAG: hypothetical protein K0Q46_4941 [Rhodococcus erythropolis]|jgi:hypothetical protein|nr:hypothetical protein [Rhodococcus erythropolis]